jgi:hypothetical protein
MREAGRWVPRNERLLLTSFFAVTITACALFSWEGFREGDESLRVGIIGAAAVGLVGTAVHQLVLWRRGELIVHDPEVRERNRERNQRVGIPLGSALGGLLLAVGFVLGDAKALLFALGGSVLLGYAPVLLWIAFVIRPDEQRARRQQSLRQ